MAPHTSPTDLDAACAQIGVASSMLGRPFSDDDDRASAELLLRLAASRARNSDSDWLLLRRLEGLGITEEEAERVALALSAFSRNVVAYCRRRAEVASQSEQK